MKSGWYEKYIGYCFTDNGKEAVLEDVYCIENETGKHKSNVYVVYYPETDKRYHLDYKEFMKIRRQTCLPR